MNKTISFASTLVLTLLIAGCGNNNSVSSSANSGKVAEAALRIVRSPQAQPLSRLR